MKIENVLLEYAIPEIRNLILEYAYKCEARPHESGYCRWCMKFIATGENELSLKVKYKTVPRGNDDCKCHYDYYVTEIISPSKDYESSSYDYMGYVKYHLLEKTDEWIVHPNNNCYKCTIYYKAISARIANNNGDILNSDTHIEFERKYECFKAIQKQRTRKNYKKSTVNLIIENNLLDSIN